MPCVGYRDGVPGTGQDRAKEGPRKVQETAKGRTRAAGLTGFRRPLKSAAMALRDILILPDKRLRKVSEPVKKIDAGIHTLIEDMFETMYDAPGIGLAAIQIGTAKRVVTMDLAKKDEPKNPQVFINPEIVWSSEEKATYEEGCLSIPEFYGDVERPAQVKVKYLDRDGQPQEVEANGLLATCLQHEIDHLNGVLFIDHLSKLKRDRVVKKFTKAAKRAAE
jgi:peptide deformylase